jgi:hypothetical protein
VRGEERGGGGQRGCADGREGGVSFCEWRERKGGTCGGGHRGGSDGGGREVEAAGESAGTQEAAGGSAGAQEAAVVRKVKGGGR